MADDVLLPYAAARARRQERAFAELLEWLGGHPLSLRLLLPQLEQIAPEDLLATLKGRSGLFPEGFLGGEGRNGSMVASMSHFFDRWPAELRKLTLALVLFEGVVDEDVLTALSATEDVPARFAGVDKAAWTAVLIRLEQGGLLSKLGGGMYELHPALRAWLLTAWQAEAGVGFATERDAADRALLAAYAAFGSWLAQQIRDGAAEAAFALLDRQSPTMVRLLTLALAKRHHAEAQALLEPLNEFWEARGLREEAKGWMKRCRQALENAMGIPPDLNSEAGALWLFVVSSEATRALSAGEPEAAYRSYDMLRQRIEDSPGPNQEQWLAVASHQLGIAAQSVGDLAAAENWYRKSLQIEEAVGNRHSMASSYHQLGMLAQRRGDLAAAENWYRKSLAINAGLDNRPGTASTYHQLGMVAQLRGEFAEAEAVLSQVAADRGHPGRSAPPSQQLPPAWECRVSPRRPRRGRGVVSSIAGDRRGTGRPAQSGPLPPSAWHGGAGSWRPCGRGGMVSQVACDQGGTRRPARDCDDVSPARHPGVHAR